MNMERCKNSSERGGSSTAHSPQQDDNTKTMIQAKKVVTFNQMVQCRAILCRYEYTREEAHHSWLSDEEMEKLTERCNKTVERMESGKSSRRESTYRGLEALSQKGESKLMGAIRETVDAVMDEQDRQFYLGVEDHEMIALASSQTSEVSLQEAIKRGRSDAREAQRCYRRLRDLEDENDHHDCSSRSDSQESTSSISVSDEHHNIVPILKTGNAVGDNCESPVLPATLDVVG